MLLFGGLIDLRAARTGLNISGCKEEQHERQNQEASCHRGVFGGICGIQLFNDELGSVIMICGCPKTAPCA